MLNIIAAVAQNGVIGKDGTLPFSLKRDSALPQRLPAPDTPGDKSSHLSALIIPARGLTFPAICRSISDIDDTQPRR